MTTNWTSNYPVSLDTYIALIDLVDQVLANHPNTLSDAVLALETKLDITGGTATGFGGISFDGVAANPGAVGAATIWVDTSGGAGYLFRYTDELGATYQFGVTLDGAYDQGGAGLGRVITVDSGAVELVGSNAADYTLEVTQSAAGGSLLVGNSGVGDAISLTGTNRTIGSDTGKLNLVTTTSGDLIISSASVLDLDASGIVSINSSAAAINIGNDAVAQAINIGIGAAARTLTIGNVTGATGTKFYANTGGFDFVGGVAPAVSFFSVTIAGSAGADSISLETVTAGDISLSSVADASFDGAGTVEIGSSALVGIEIGSASVPALYMDTVDNSMSMAAAGWINTANGGYYSVNSTAGPINIGNGAHAFAINIGTGAAARVITIGNVTGATGVQINTGTAGLLINAGAALINTVLDEDLMGTDSDTALATQQSIKAYVDAQVTASDSLQEAYVIGQTISTTAAGDLAFTITTNGNFTTTNGTDQWDFTYGGVNLMSVNADLSGFDLNTSAAVLITTGTTFGVAATGAIDIQSVAAVTIDSSGGDIGIGTDADAHWIRVGTAGVRDIRIGNNAGATGIELNAGSDGIGMVAVGGPVSISTAAGSNMSLQSAGTLLVDVVGVLELNSSGGVISIGNDAVAQAINVGTGAAARTITIGNVTGATGVQINTGTAGLLINAGAALINTVLDEDLMGTDSDTALATQQSIKAYVDAQVTASDSLQEAYVIGQTISTTAAGDLAFTITTNGNFTTTNGTDQWDFTYGGANLMSVNADLEGFDLNTSVAALITTGTTFGIDATGAVDINGSSTVTIDGAGNSHFYSGFSGGNVQTRLKMYDDTAGLLTSYVTAIETEGANNEDVTSVLISNTTNTAGTPTATALIDAYGGNTNQILIGATPGALTASSVSDIHIGSDGNGSADRAINIGAVAQTSNIVMGAGTDITFQARGGNIVQVNSAADPNLETTATNLIGAINEIRAVSTITTVAAATYTVLSTDVVISVTYTTTGTCVITVPTAVIAVSGRKFTIKDGGLNALTNNITIETQAAETIDGNADAIINGDGDAITLISDGSNLFII